MSGEALIAAGGSAEPEVEVVLIVGRYREQRAAGDTLVEAVEPERAKVLA